MAARKLSKSMGSGKKSPKAKNPEAPKRALSSYFIWLKEERKNICKAGMGVTDVTKEAGRIWRGMAAKEKKKWEDLAAKDKIRYQKELAAFSH